MYSLSLKSIWYATIRNYMSFRKLFKVAVFPNLLDPVLYLVAMGIGLAGFVGKIDGMSYFMFVTSGLAAATGMNAATNEATTNAYIQMKVEKTYYAVSMTPVNIQDIVVAQAIWSGVRATIFGTLFLVIAGVLGAVRSWMVIGIPVILLLSGILFGLLGLTFTIIVKNRDFLNYYVMLIIQPMYMFSNTFFPISSMPKWLQPYSTISPLYHSVALCRGLITGNLNGVLGNLIWIIAVIVVLTPLPIVLAKKKLVY